MTDLALLALLAAVFLLLLGLIALCQAVRA
jgi:hypothetical protein